MYVDEAGCPGALPSAYSPVQPVFTLVGLIVPVPKIKRLTVDLLKLKEKYQSASTRRSTHSLQILLEELKGSALRKHIAKGNRNLRRRGLRIFDDVFELLKKHNVRVLGRVYIKAPGEDFDGKSVYTSAIQMLFTDFQNFLSEKKARGIVALDSRKHYQNSDVSFSIFTKKYKAHGDPYRLVIEAPLFSHSENSAGLQLADLLASGVLTPMSIHTYCTGTIKSVHVVENYSVIQNRYKDALRESQFRYLSDTGGYKGGIVVSDGIKKNRGASYLFS